MAYLKNFVVAVKSNNTVLREFEDTVYVPFDSDYSILLKNLNSRKALVKITIDGKSIGNQLILNANDTIELERFIQDNLNNGYKFKFVKRIEEIEKNRGINVDDGIIRVEFTYEKEIENVTWITTTIPNYTYGISTYPYISIPDIYGTGTISFDFNSTVSSDPNTVVNSSTISDYNQVYMNSTNNTTNSINLKDVVSDVGITVKGDDSNQKFTYGSIGLLENNSNVICIKLKGIVNENEIKKPITVNDKIKCENCGKFYYINKDIKFCSTCGTRLIY
jgi:hypothetical protein